MSTATVKTPNTRTTTTTTTANQIVSKGRPTIGASGVGHSPPTFFNVSVFTILTLLPPPPTFQCIVPPPSNSWPRPCLLEFDRIINELATVDGCLFTG